MTHTFDVIILGGGNAGFGVSAIVSEAGKSVAFVEEAEFGGVCPNRGCTPKKVLVAAATALDQIARAPAHGVSVGPAKLDWSALIERKTEMIGFIPGAMEGLAEKRGTVFRGRGRFISENRVQVGEDILEAEHIVIATGSTPRSLPIPGAEHLITSDEVLSDPKQPESVIFIGGGVVALEFAHVYARAGTQVAVLEVAPQILPRFEQDAVRKLCEEAQRQGIESHVGVKVLGVETTGDKLTVRYELDGEERTATADKVINGAGRVPNVAGLELAAADIAHDGLRIDVTPSGRSTSNPRVWVAGDASPITPQLSPFATHEGRLIGQNILDGGDRAPDYSGAPSAVYAIPSLATVGLTEKEARERHKTIRVTENDMTGWFSGKSYAESVAWAKVIIDEESDAILGAHLVGHNAEDLIQIFGLAMQHGISASALKASHFAYPAFSSDIKNLL